MQSNRVMNLIALTLVTSFVMPSMGQQARAPLSQNGTLKFSQMVLPAELKNLPLILDSKNLNSEKFKDLKVEKLVAPQGPRTGGGGNACALNITTATVLIKDNLDKVPFKGNQREEFLKKIKNVLFLQGANLEVKGQSVNAINYPEFSAIVLDQKACDYLGEENVYGYALLLHEYLGVAGIDDRTYQLSGTFSKKIKDLVSSTGDCNFDDCSRRQAGQMRQVRKFVASQLLNKNSAIYKAYVKSADGEDPAEKIKEVLKDLRGIVVTHIGQSMEVLDAYADTQHYAYNNLYMVSIKLPSYDSSGANESLGQYSMLVVIEHNQSYDKEIIDASHDKVTNEKTKIEFKKIMTAW